MNLNKIVSTVLIVLMLLDGAIPASAGGGQKRTIEQREGDSIIVDRYIPQKRRRLESSEIIGTQGLKRTFLIDGTNLIVMSLEKTPVMAFACFSDAVRWLRVNGWNCRGAPSIKNAILKKYLSCGWRWDIQIKTKETEKLLLSKPTAEQMEQAKKNTKGRNRIGKSKLLVMKLGGIPVKTFTICSKAEGWLVANGWGCTNHLLKKKIGNKVWIHSGWEWEIQDRTEELERLLIAEPTTEQVKIVRNRVKKKNLIGDTNLLVMKSGETPVKAFDSVYGALKWLQANGWDKLKFFKIKKVVGKQCFFCGWKWEIQCKTKLLEKLLVSNPTEEQMREAKGFNIIRGVIAETKLLVMKLKKVPVKAFTNINDACEWLRKNGWESSNCSNVSRAVEKQYMLHGWEWEIRDKTGDLARLLVTEPTEEQMQTARKCMRKKLKIDENELIVMKSGEVPVKTFTEVFEAVNWLKSNGWTFANYSKITQIIRKKGFLYGWKWEKQEKTKELEKLLGVEPVVEQFQVVKNPKLNSVDENVSHDDDLSTSGIPICTLPSLHDTTVEKEGLADTDDYCETAIFDEVGLQRDVLMYDFEKEEEMFSSEEIFSELYY